MKKTKKNINSKESIKQLKNLISDSLENSKAIDINFIDVSDKTDFCIYMFVVSGSSTRHVANIAEKLGYAIKHSDLDVSFKLEGQNEGRWVLLDAIDIVVHVFLPDVRERYKIEDIWQ